MRVVGCDLNTFGHA